MNLHIRLRPMGACIVAIGFALTHSAFASEENGALVEGAQESISEVMLEDAGLELEDTAPPALVSDSLDVARDNAAEEDLDAMDGEEQAFVPAKAAPSP